MQYTIYLDVHADGLKYDEEVEDEPSKMIKDQSPSQTHNSRILGSSNVPSSYPDNDVSDKVPSSDDAIHDDDVDKEAGPEGINNIFSKSIFIRIIYIH